MNVTVPRSDMRLRRSLQQTHRRRVRVTVRMEVADAAVMRVHVKMNAVCMTRRSTSAPSKTSIAPTASSRHCATLAGIDLPKNNTIVPMITSVSVWPMPQATPCFNGLRDG